MGIIRNLFFQNVVFSLVALLFSFHSNRTIAAYLNEDDLPGYSHESALRANPALLRQWFIMNSKDLKEVGGQKELDRKIQSNDLRSLAPHVDKNWLLNQFAHSLGIHHNQEAGDISELPNLAETHKLQTTLSWLPGMPKNTDWYETVHSNLNLERAFYEVLSSCEDMGPIDTKIMQAILAQELIIATGYAAAPLFEGEYVFMKNETVFKASEALTWQQEQGEDHFTKMGDEEKYSVATALNNSKHPTEALVAAQSFINVNTLEDIYCSRVIGAFAKSEDPYRDAVLAQTLLRGDMDDLGNVEVLENLVKSDNPEQVTEIARIVSMGNVDGKKLIEVVKKLANAENLVEEKLTAIAQNLFTDDMNDSHKASIEVMLTYSKNPEQLAELALNLFTDDIDADEIIKIFVLLTGSENPEQLAELVQTVFTDDMDIEKRMELIDLLEGSKDPEQLAELAQRLITSDMDGTSRLNIVLALYVSPDLEELCKQSKSLYRADMLYREKVQIVCSLAKGPSCPSSVKEAVDRLAWRGINGEGIVKILVELAKLENPENIALAVQSLFADDTNIDARNVADIIKKLAEFTGESKIDPITFVKDLKEGKEYKPNLTQYEKVLLLGDFHRNFLPTHTKT